MHLLPSHLNVPNHTYLRTKLAIVFDIFGRAVIWFTAENKLNKKPLVVKF